jgi:hypothetical protein
MRAPWGWYRQAGLRGCPRSEYPGQPQLLRLQSTRLQHRGALTLSTTKCRILPMRVEVFPVPAPAHREEAAAQHPAVPLHHS